MRNYASQRYKNEWFRHPVIGDPSFDTFRRHTHNPIYRGQYPFEWPVNGSLFRDPVSNRLYMYISLYYKGYWSIKDPDQSLHCIAYRSDDEGLTWQEVGLMLEGSKHSYDSEEGMRGGAADMCVVYDQGVYHALFGWATSANTDGGIGYASASSPEGPFIISDTPIHQETRQPLLGGKYKRVYASSLIKREQDWLIIAMMSTPRNWGGTWALVSMTAKQPEGPYSAPELLVYPQSKTFHPPITEFFPAFQDDRYVYCPFTSLALNRNFQVIYKAEKNQAHLASAWLIEKYGSLWHSEDLEHEQQGIWGQTLAGLLEQDGRLRVMYPAKSAPDTDQGTINYAECDWNEIDGNDSFWLSAPNGPALSFIQQEYEQFVLEAKLHSGGEKSVLWAYDSPIGPDITTAGASLHPLMARNRMELRWADGKWSLIDTDAEGSSILLSSGTYAPAVEVSDSICIGYERSGSSITINGEAVWQGTLGIRSGKIGLLAGKGSHMHVTCMKLDRTGTSGKLTYLSSEGLIGAGEAPMKPSESMEPEGWKRMESGQLRFGAGHYTNVPGSRVKWNYIGSRFQIWSPRGSELGLVKLYLDGELTATIDLRDPSDQESAIVFESGDVPYGYHAVTLELIDGAMICDSMDFWT
ncbi:exo-alpha-sialidase [Paenibacillus mendelii]|uniref:Exo-alpha-sialidase n=1 Tax=Paenibacillus mendelii TaxID=206163 RepID=A0ABV6JL65_9BACL|nr:exo-alpha-sialidase [Paenibacillus mendelii]MCQ6562323.1 exo-alpha-sialidase [Paenibacillus mendelii]